MKAENAQYVAQLKELNQSMLQLAEKGEWEQLTDMEKKRRELIDMFIKNAGGSDSEVVAACIKEAQANNKILKKMANETRDQVIQDINKIRQRKSVSHAYNQNLPNE